MGKQSRDKGNRFERLVAREFSNSFSMNVRRVPASGGLDIKSDLYCPEDDTFPYFVECKNRKTFRFDSLFRGNSELYEFMCEAIVHAEDAYVHQKYGERQIPIVVFTGGDFTAKYVMLLGVDLDRTFQDGDMPSFLSVGLYLIVELGVFLGKCRKKQLGFKKYKNYPWDQYNKHSSNIKNKSVKILQEDDGEPA